MINDNQPLYSSRTAGHPTWNPFILIDYEFFIKYLSVIVSILFYSVNYDCEQYLRLNHTFSSARIKYNIISIIYILYIIYY